MASPRHQGSGQSHGNTNPFALPSARRSVLPEESGMEANIVRNAPLLLVALDHPGLGPGAPVWYITNARCLAETC